MSTSKLIPAWLSRRTRGTNHLDMEAPPPPPTPTTTEGPLTAEGREVAPTVPSGRSDLPMLHVAETFRNNFIAMVGEFVGTFLFLFFAFAGTQVAKTQPAPADTSTGAPPNTLIELLYSSLAFGFSLMVNVWAFYRVTGGLFNPAVTLALCLCGGMPALRGVLVFVAQLVAGIASAGVVSALFPGPLEVGTTLGGGTNIAQGLFIEMFLTAQLVIVIIMLAVVKHKSTFLAPVGIGIVFFVTQLIGDYYTGGSLNPARSLGPAVINHSFPGYFWIYWVGPLLGSLLASSFFGFLQLFRYQTVNPGQDYNEWEAEAEGGPAMASPVRTWDARPSAQFSDASTLPGGGVGVRDSLNRDSLKGERRGGSESHARDFGGRMMTDGGEVRDA